MLLTLFVSLNSLVSCRSRRLVIARVAAMRRTAWGVAVDRCVRGSLSALCGGPRRRRRSARYVHQQRRCAAGMLSLRLRALQVVGCSCACRGVASRYLRHALAGVWGHWSARESWWQELSQRDRPVCKTLLGLSPLDAFAEFLIDLRVHFDGSCKERGGSSGFGWTTPPQPHEEMRSGGIFLPQALEACSSAAL